MQRHRMVRRMVLHPRPSSSIQPAAETQIQSSGSGIINVSLCR